jgi:hypothetical protein
MLDIDICIHFPFSFGAMRTTGLHFAMTFLDLKVEG